MMRVVFFLMILFTRMAVCAQIVNVESSRIQSDTTGWVGTIGSTFSYTSHVQQILGIDATAHLQYKTERNLYLFLANYNLLKVQEEDFSNNMFYHLRYNYKVNEWLRWEVFTQWQQNIITNIELRALLGSGPRFKLYERSRFRLYAAALAMYEYEKDRDPPAVHKDLRSDNYVSFTYKPNPLISLTSTTFYQPLFRQLNDFRILNQLTLNFKATKNLSFITNWSYLYDSAPPLGTPRVNFSISNGFSYTLK